MAVADHLIYAVAWLSFGVFHSILAADSVKARLPFQRSYRLVYNGFALVHFVGVIWCGRMILGSPAALHLSDTDRLAGDAVSVAGIAVIFAALAGYDRRQFLGTAQLADSSTPPDEPLRTGGLHRYVRHPLYSGLFLLVWGQAQTEFGFATALWASVYLIIGSIFEERRLVHRYGQEYDAYRRRVPAFITWRGRVAAD